MVGCTESTIQNHLMLSKFDIVAKVFISIFGPLFSLGNPGKETDKDEDGEGEEVVKNLMSDIQSGFSHRRLPDGGFKVREKIMNLVLQSFNMPIRITILYQNLPGVS